jgi:cell division protein FtsB
LGRIARILLPGLVLLALYWTFFGGEYSVWELRRARAELEASRAELAALREEIDSLRAWADSLRDDPWTLERLAREEHGLVRDGEEVIRVTGAPDEAALPPDSAGGGGG